TIEHKLDVEEINKPDYQTKQSHIGTKGFFNKAKYLLLVPLIVATIACIGDYEKELLNKEHIQIRSNSDCSKIMMKKIDSKKREKRTFILSGPPVEDFLDVVAAKLKLEEYIYNPKGCRGTKKYDEREDSIEGYVLREKEPEAQKLFRNNYDHMVKYLKR
ncbi:unnamed protein product, partial [marine sediment metagenome]